MTDSTLAPLRAALDPSGVIAPLLDGRVTLDPETMGGRRIDFLQIDPILDAYRRMVRHQEFDICQLTPTTYLMARAAGAPYKALPFFLSRRFHHKGLICRAQSGIKQPKDLEGKRVGARSYTLTTAVWSRGIYTEEYGLDPDKVTWVVNDDEHLTDFPLPQNVERVPSEQSLIAMLEAGTLDAAFVAQKALRNLPQTGYYDLFAGDHSREAEWFARTGVYPMHALIVVREDLLARAPDAVRALMRGLQAAHDLWLSDLEHQERTAPESLSKKDRSYLALRAIVGPDPLPMGLSANRASSEALQRYALRQGLMTRPLSMEEIFVTFEGEA